VPLTILGQVEKEGSGELSELGITTEIVEGGVYLAAGRGDEFAENILQVLSNRTDHRATGQNRKVTQVAPFACSGIERIGDRQTDVENSGIRKKCESMGRKV